LISTLEIRPWWLFVPWVEGLLTSPISPILPGSLRDLPAIYAKVEPAVLLELPGPLAFPPGEPNPSRPRARWLLYAQLQHHAASPWTLDFNGVARTADAPWLSSFRSWDRALNEAHVPPDVASARTAGVSQALVWRNHYGKAVAAELEAALREQGAVLVAEDEERALYRF